MVPCRGTPNYLGPLTATKKGTITLGHTPVANFALIVLADKLHEHVVALGRHLSLV